MLKFRLYRPPKIIRLIYYRRTWGLSPSGNTIYLSFDDGPDPEITPWVLDQLKERSIRATFFCVGENIDQYPDIYQRILHEGHVVGNHTQKHLKAGSVSSREYLENIQEAQQAIPGMLFRPPYGRLSPRASRKISKQHQIIMWSWLSYDFDLEVPTETILKQAARQIRAGDIIVLHDNRKIAERQKELLPQLLDQLEEAGFQFGVIKSEL
ncbi:MAG: polysaccharide deacetylase family protein [Bacteroidetes bacterium]|nr:MAG: polysaccharide deacetylase family protein [Bacteroidota bacterium]